VADVRRQRRTPICVDLAGSRVPSHAVVGDEAVVGRVAPTNAGDDARIVAARAAATGGSGTACIARRAALSSRRRRTRPAAKAAPPRAARRAPAARRAGEATRAD